jgi:hypothetical protein
LHSETQDHTVKPGIQVINCAYDYAIEQQVIALFIIWVLTIDQAVSVSPEPV